MESKLLMISLHQNIECGKAGSGTGKVLQWVTGIEEKEKGDKR